MKILIVAQNFWPENFRINDLATGLTDRGHEVTVFTGLPNYPQGSFFKGYSIFGPYTDHYGKVLIKRIPIISRGKSKGIRLALNYLSFAILGSLLIRFICREKYDAIFVYQPSPVTLGLPAVVLKILTGTPVYFWVTDLWPDTLVATGIISSQLLIGTVTKLVEFLYYHSKVILVSSKGFIGKIKSLGVDERKIVYWPQWAENLYESHRDAHQLSLDEKLPEGFKLMFAGNIGQSQDFETLLKAAEIVRDEGLTDIHWIILGDGRHREWVEQQVQRRKLKANFHMLGFKPVEYMPLYFEQTDVLVVSLKNDPLFAITVPSKLQSYLASGKPILGSLNGEGADLIREARAGFATQASNPRALAELIKKFHRLNKDKLDILGENGRQYFKQNFDRVMLFDKLENMMFGNDHANKS